jgi:hypothetical protein
MIIGVTATQRGLTIEQKTVARAMLENADELHHGDCIGGDNELDTFAKELGILRVIHPPLKEAKRAHCERKGGLYVLLAQKDYRPRNCDIVSACSRLLVFPQGPEESYPRSGTWMTYRIARNVVGRDRLIVYPSGFTVREDG